MSILLNDLGSIKMVDTGLVSNRKASQILKYCETNGIVSVKDFLDFYYKNGVIGRRVLEITGLVDLLNYKYLNIVNKDYLKVLDSKLTTVDLSKGIDKYRNRNDLNLLKRLGLTNEEIRSFYYFAGYYKNERLIDIVRAFINPSNCHIYLGAYLDILFIEKMNLICHYYHFRKKRITKPVQENDNKVSKIVAELEELKHTRNKVSSLKEQVIVQMEILGSLEQIMTEKELFLENLIQENSILLEEEKNAYYEECKTYKKENVKNIAK